MDFNEDYIWVYIVLFMILSLLFSYFYEKKRTEKLKVIAKNLGFNFSKNGRDITVSKHETFELFSKGHGKKFQNEMWGVSDGNHVSIFGYNYTQGHGKNSTTYKQTVLSIECNQLNSPSFELKPENTFHKIGQVFGYQDIDFEAFPTFSKKYLLRGDDEIKIREFFTPKVIAFFESNLNICIEAKGSILIFYKLSKRCKPDEIESFYKRGQVTLSNLTQV